MWMRVLAVPAIVAVLLVSACSAPPSPRTTPNQVEKSAVQLAQSRAPASGSTVSDQSWTQLWTPKQGGELVRSCVARASGGTVSFHAEPNAESSGGLSYSVEVTVSTANGVLMTPDSVDAIVFVCLAGYPIDYRMSAVPERDRDALYSYDLTTLRRCLISHGQKVPKLPSRVRFENLIRASAPWNAYDDVVVASRMDWYALADACPAFPPAIAADIAAAAAP